MLCYEQGRKKRPHPMTSPIYWLAGELDFSPPAQLESTTGNQLNKLSTQHI